MESTASSLFDPGVEFPSIPQEKIPEDSLALQRILAGERGMSLLYAQLERSLQGESHCLALLLSRHWERRFGGLIRSGESIVRSLKSDGDARKTLPTPDQIERIVRALEGGPPQRVFEVVAGFASRALLCYQMVPWVSNVKEVFEHFKACVEAEDHHLAVIDLFGDLLKPAEQHG